MSATRTSTHTRDEVISQVLTARSLEEIRAARGVLLAWMRNHPDDGIMLDGGEQLATLEATILGEGGDAYP
jgi:hypothetical protein